MHETVWKIPDECVKLKLSSALDFDTGGTKCDVNVLAETAYNRHSKETATFQLCHDKTWVCFSSAVNNMCVEFKDISTWINGNAKRTTYEDNPKFYSERFSIGTNYTVKYIMRKFANKESTLDVNVLLPGANGHIFNLKLNNLKGYYQAMGLPWVFGWSAYTTDDIR